MNAAPKEIRLAAPDADDRGLTSSPALQLDPLLLLLRMDGAEHVSLPPSTLFRLMYPGSGVLLKPALLLLLLPGRFRRGIVSFSLNRVRSFFCS